MNESIDWLRCHFGLTLAEARLALHLVRGETLRSAAVKLNITYETARSSLKTLAFLQRFRPSVFRLVQDQKMDRSTSFRTAPHLPVKSLLEKP
jgi:hypothetical protein